MKKVWLAPLLLLIVLFGLRAEGGIIEALNNILKPVSADTASWFAQAETGTRVLNSQNLSLPEPEAFNNSTSTSRNELIAKFNKDGSVLAEAGPLGTAVDLKDGQAPSDLVSVYTVRAGDDLETIARLFNVSVNTIRWSNDLKKGQALKVGETLAILPITGVKHIVKKGDTLKSVANKYKGDIQEIIIYNDLNPNEELKVGETIIIPDGEEGTIVQTVKQVAKVVAKPSNSASRGYYLWPVAGGRKTQGLHGHNAVDIGAPVGTPVYAAAEGRVILARYSGWNGGYGNYFIIAHPNGTQTLYSHVASIFVSVGQRVDRGEQVGTVGSTGRSTGPHLHFEVRGASNPF